MFVSELMNTVCVKEPMEKRRLRSLKTRITEEPMSLVRVVSALSVLSSFISIER